MSRKWVGVLSCNLIGLIPSILFVLFHLNIFSGWKIYFPTWITDTIQTFSGIWYAGNMMYGIFAVPIMIFILIITLTIIYNEYKKGDLNKSVLIILLILFILNMVASFWCREFFITMAKAY